MFECRKISMLLAILILVYFCFEELNIYRMIPIVRKASPTLKSSKPAVMANIPPALRDRYANRSTIIKSFDLQNLLTILNSQRHLFQEWDVNCSNEEFSLKYALFLSNLLPWVTGDPPSPLVELESRSKLPLHCADKRYSTALTGQQLSKPRVIVDFIPFGYDVDKLELRLLENYDIVDAFVIYESTLTQTGTKKPYIFQMIRHSPRFHRFNGKIIYLHANSFDLRERLGSSWRWGPDQWQLESMMRSELLRRFQEMSPSHEQYGLYRAVQEAVDAPSRHLADCRSRLDPAVHPYDEGEGGNGVAALWRDIKACRYSDQLDRDEPIALGLQNDGDELPTGPALNHLKHCVLRQPTGTVFLPAFSYKNSIELLHRESDDNNIEGAVMPSLQRFIAVSPAIHAAPLAYFLAHNSTFRGAPVRSHMNLGAGVHLSSTAEPVERWFKAISTQHGMQNLEMRKVMPAWLIEAGRRGEITADMVRNISDMNEACGSRNANLVPVSTLSREESGFVRKALPWALQANAHRYPFLAPAACVTLSLNRKERLHLAQYGKKSPALRRMG